MINKNIEDITERDLQLLIENETLESKTLEYKRELPQDLSKLLEAVSSFANANGGDLIIGLSEDRESGKPKSLDGINIENIDQEILRIEHSILDNIKPRILPSLIIKPILLQNSKTAIIIRIPKSINGPHGVYYRSNKHGQFFSRNSNGKHPMDISELRIAFNLSETIIERVKRFNIDRAKAIINNDTPVPLYNSTNIAVHVIPLMSFNPSQFYDIRVISNAPGKMPPINSPAFSNRFNLDGFITYSDDDNHKSFSYVQLYKSGIIEAVNSSMLNNEGKKIYPSYERKIVESLKEYLSLLKEISVELPMFIFIDLLKVKGYTMAVSPEQFDIRRTNTIDREIALLPEVIIENYDDNIPQLLKPVFDSIWNACGLPRSLNFNEDGEWAPMR
jgi:hypothetical protein